MQKHLTKLVHKRTFESSIEQLSQSFIALDSKFTNSMPALQYEVKNAIKKQVTHEQIDEFLSDKASIWLVETIIGRINRLEEIVQRGGGQGKGKLKDL